MDDRGGFVGAWGNGNFENDDAKDWVAELSTIAPTDLSTILTQAADQPEYLEAPSAYVALAAAEVVAALKGAPAASAPMEVGEWVKRNSKALTPELKSEALRAAGRVRRDSEVKDLWMEADGLNDWIEVVKDLQARLGE
jgi:hypothetical protein